MKKVYDVIMGLRAVSGKLDKLAILKRNADNPDLKEFLRVIEEPRINLYMTKIVKGTQTCGPKIKFDAALFNMVVDQLSLRKETGNAAKTWVACLRASFSNEWERELLDMLITRNTKTGVGTSLINATWANLVTDVPYMRCCLPKDTKLEDFPWVRGVYVQTKMDGMFANINHLDDGTVEITSRNGSPFPIDAFSEIEEYVKKNVPTGIQVHGELLVKNQDGYLSRQAGNGILNSLLQGGAAEPGLVPVFRFWDAIGLSKAVAKGKDHTPYHERFNDFVASMTFSEVFAPVHTVIVNSLAAAREEYKNSLANGEEGVIIKHPDMIWQDTTSKQQVKLKLEFEVELKIVGFTAGNNKNEATFGAILCESACGQLKVGVGSGFSDAMRVIIWNQHDDMIGKVITVKSNCIMTPDNKDYWSLFLPIYIETRLDKKTANTLEEIYNQYEASL